MQLYRIINGWKNYVSKDVEIEKLAKERVKSCIDCEHKKEGKFFKWVKDDIKEIEGTVCGLCECPIAMKVRSINEKCPKNKW